MDLSIEGSGEPEDNEGNLSEEEVGMFAAGRREKLVCERAYEYEGAGLKPKMSSLSMFGLP